MRFARYLAARRLHGPNSREVVALGREDLGPYEAIRQEWRNRHQRPDLIVALLDTHLQESKETRSRFGWYALGWRYFILEYHALRRVRRHEGLGTPVPEYHVLLDSPLAWPPEELPPLQDDLIIRYLANIRRHFPDF